MNQEIFTQIKDVFFVEDVEARRKAMRRIEKLNVRTMRVTVEEAS